VGRSQSPRAYDRHSRRERPRARGPPGKPRGRTVRQPAVHRREGVDRSARTFCSRRGTRPAARPGSTSTTCGTAATPGLRPPAPARRNSWPGWATRALQLRCGISTQPPIAIGRSPPPSAHSGNRHLPQCLRPSRLSADPRDRARAGSAWEQGYWGAPDRIHFWDARIEALSSRPMYYCLAM